MRHPPAMNRKYIKANKKAKYINDEKEADETDEPDEAVVSILNSKEKKKVLHDFSVLLLYPNY
jgi:hypothetical protein